MELTPKLVHVTSLRSFDRRCIGGGKEKAEGTMEGLRNKTVKMGIDGTGQRNPAFVLKIERTLNGK